MFKRSISLTLALVLLLSGIPVTALGRETEEMEEILETVEVTAPEENQPEATEEPLPTEMEAATEATESSEKPLPSETAATEPTVATVPETQPAEESLAVISEGDGVAIDETNFPDDVFRAYVSDNFDTDSDGTLSSEEIAGATQISIVKTKLSSLVGIEYFTALTRLDCHSNNLITLDVRKNIALERLDCSDNQLTVLDVSCNTALTSLDCERNELTMLDVSKNTALRTLYCGINQLTSLDVSKNSKLNFMDASGNCYVISVEENREFDLSTLPGSFDVSKSSDWKLCEVNGTKLVPVLGAEKITYTYDCGNDKRAVFTLVVTGGFQFPRIPITETNFPDEKFREYIREELDTGGYGGVLTSNEIASVTRIDVFNKGITSLAGIEYFPLLTTLDCGNNDLTELDVSKNTALTWFSCSNTKAETLDVSKNTALEYLNCSSNNLTTLDVSKNTALKELWCECNELTSLNLMENTVLEYLYCGENQLTTLDLQHNIKLYALDCEHNQLTTLDVRKNIELRGLTCNYNQLTALDVSQNTGLKSLHCVDNQLTALDVSNNADLEQLWCSYNRLTSLDLRQNNKISSWRCYSNEYTITVSGDRTFNLATLPGSFDTWKTSSWNGGTVSGNTLTVDANTGYVSYTYYCGNGHYMEVKLIVEEKVTLPVPAKPYKIANVVSGVHVYWKAVSGVEKYGLWRSETGKNGTYNWIGNPSVPHFTDTKVESGKTYWYKVTSLDTDTNTHSDKSEAIGLTYVATPDITLRVNRAVGIGLGWNKIEGATGYAIYRKSYSGSDAWVRIATISGNDTLTWNDTSVKNKNGEVYRYTIRALAGSNMKTLSGCRNTGRTMVRITSLTLSKVEKISAHSIRCTWTKNSAVTGYEVRFMVGSTVYKTFTIGNVNTLIKTFHDLPSGQTYKIQVRSYKVVSGVGSFYSAWSTAKNLTL